MKVITSLIEYIEVAGEICETIGNRNFLHCYTVDGGLNEKVTYMHD